VDGARFGSHEILGVVLPVSYERGPAETLRLARAHAVDMVLGFGVAADRPGVCVERRAVQVDVGRPDVDGCCAATGPGPAVIHATLEVESLAGALGATVSEDAGTYVCNAWLYAVSRALDVPVGFVHVPMVGLSAEVLLDTLRRWL